MKTVGDFAKLLNGREYGQEITGAEVAEANKAGLVVVFGGSDDNMEFRGTIYDEVGCYNGGDAFVDFDGLVTNKCDCEDCPYHQQEKQKSYKITAVWNVDGYSWIYKTDIPHETFDILEDGETYCRGIVFAIQNLAFKTAV